jgi:hypothetical protein
MGGLGAGAGAGAAAAGAGGRGGAAGGTTGACTAALGRSPAGMAGRWVGAPATVEGRGDGATPFVEIGKTAAHTWHRARTPAGGILAGSIR